MKTSGDEIFEIVDEDNKVIGTARRAECHGNPALIHRTSHVVVFNPDGRVLLQRRSHLKDIQPGKWDTAVGGHLDPGEDFETAARREMQEELGLPSELELQYLFDAKIRNQVESENTRVFGAVYAGPFNYPDDEIDEVRFFTAAELRDAAIRTGFTPNLLKEIDELFRRNLLREQ